MSEENQLQRQNRGVSVLHCKDEEAGSVSLCYKFKLFKGLLELRVRKVITDTIRLTNLFGGRPEIKATGESLIIQNITGKLSKLEVSSDKHNQYFLTGVQSEATRRGCRSVKTLTGA